MKNYYDYLSLLLKEEEVPLPRQVIRIYICYLDNEFLRDVLGFFLNKRWYRKYYVKIKIYDGMTIVRRIRYRTVDVWRERIDEINMDIYRHSIRKV